ncbi:lysozyme inhibitor LprI family protein [Pararhizobium arenae]|uniref:lysozyme inhibitor LprI family protein n=1 Tax=Pararhizobium arenae TaxID=1856850 RepID=UPI00094AD05E|nr:lysozyme inhibitor LprI family protein [Pararhizobium arenae]
MKRGVAPLLMACGVVLIAGGARAHEDEPKVDCANAMTQMEINICASRDYEAADKELNAQWAKTRKVMVDWDAELEEQNKGAVDSLMKAQRAWIEYRDGQCDAVGYSVWGGTMYPAVVAGCLADLTRKRTEELKDLANGIEQ